jgi:hypothetical protein
MFPGFASTRTRNRQGCNSVSFGKGSPCPPLLAKETRFLHAGHSQLGLCMGFSMGHATILHTILHIVFTSSDREMRWVHTRRGMTEMTHDQAYIKRSNIFVMIQGITETMRTILFASNHHHSIAFGIQRALPEPTALVAGMPVQTSGDTTPKTVARPLLHMLACTLNRTIFRLTVAYLRRTGQKRLLAVLTRANDGSLVAHGHTLTETRALARASLGDSSPVVSALPQALADVSLAQVT